MSIGDYESLPEPELNAALARAIGWSLEYRQRPGPPTWILPDGKSMQNPPDWDLSYNEWHKYVRPALTERWNAFSTALATIISPAGDACFSLKAEPKQLCIAALVALGNGDSATRRP